MQKRQLEAILTPKCHGTANCRHAIKAKVSVPVFVEGWQRGQSHNQGPKDDCKWDWEKYWQAATSGPLFFCEPLSRDLTATGCG